MSDSEEEQEVTPVSQLTAQGYLHKKNPGGIPGARIWKKRWCRAGFKSPEGRYCLAYFRNKDEVTPCGFVHFDEMCSVSAALSKQPVGCRFDIECTNGRVYEFKAANPMQCETWLQQLLSVQHLFGRREVPLS
ncbi:MAG: hypothetical protein MHM6MM_008370 [Cercozoa sp. M6MM]